MSEQESKELAQKFLKRLQELYEYKKSDLNIFDIRTIMQSLTDSQQKSLYDKIHEIAEKINATKSDLSDVDTSKLSAGVVPDANLELEEVVKHTEKATNTILDAASNIQEQLEGLPEDKVEKITKETTDIFEACSFQDITGQRINKVVKALLDIEGSITGMVEMLPESESGSGTSDADLMQGPQKESEAPSQDDIDKLFASLD